MLLRRNLLPRKPASWRRSPLVVNVRDKGAKGDGRTDDTEAIQAAIDEVGGTGGTVLVPQGAYMVDAVKKKRRLALKSDMTLKLAKDAVLKAIANNSRKYSVLSISDVSNVTVVGGTLEGDRTEHKGKAGEAGMGIRIDNGAKRVTISGVTSRKMWGDGFYVEGAKDTKFCGVIADNNHRPGPLHRRGRRRALVRLGVQEYAWHRADAGIDLEPDHAEQKDPSMCASRIRSSSTTQAPASRSPASAAPSPRSSLPTIFPRQSAHPRRECSSGACVGDLRQSPGQLANGTGRKVLMPSPIRSMSSSTRTTARRRDMRFEVNRQTRKKNK